MVRGDLVTKTRSRVRKKDEAIERRATKKSASKADATIVGVGCAVGGTFLGQYGLENLRFELASAVF
jgi:hypothetical protein